MNDKAKKICYVLPNFDLNIDTHYFYLYDFINEVAKDLELTLLIEKSNSDISFFKNVHKIYQQKFSWKPLRVIENFLLLFWIRLAGVKNYYIHYSYISAINATVIARLSGARTFYWSCGMMWLFARDRALEFILKSINYLVTGVETLKAGYIEHYNITQDRIKIMPNWVDLARFTNIDSTKVLEKYKLNSKGLYILFVHRLAKRKGAHYIAQLAKDNPEYKFLIAGDGPYKEDLEKEIKDLNNVIILGKVPNKDIPSLMKISKLFFMPSEEEGFPRVLLEAMAAGLPYVAYDIGGVREISSPEQQKYIVSGVSNMDRAIKSILSSEEEYNKLKQANLEQVKQFDIKIVKDKFSRLFS
ncbi:MAG: glycosyltransferase family 4 protein [Patescibacteria group bacterium]|jgi:glycosyltransferase involved in cell wall biosynthesis